MQNRYAGKKVDDFSRRALNFIRSTVHSHFQRTGTGSPLGEAVV
jgi:hypothetical protein